MVITRSMARKQNYEACTRKRIGGGVPWSDLNHDVLYSIMMRLGVIEFLSFSGVCKPWRSLAVSNKKTFMASKPPMLLSYEKEDCYLHDFEGRKFKTIITELVGRTCVGVSCGYLILFGRETRDFWLVNPIKRHQLHFPGFPLDDVDSDEDLELRGGVHLLRRAILVFSPSINEWVFALMHKLHLRVWYSIAGKGAWNYVRTKIPLLDIHVLKGKIYTLHSDTCMMDGRSVRELILDPVPISMPRLTLPDTLFLHPRGYSEFITSDDENLYLMEYSNVSTYNVYKLDVDQLNCVPCEKTTQEYAIFSSRSKCNAAVRSGPWAASLPPSYHRFPHISKPGKGRLYVAHGWYFPHECLNVNLIQPVGLDQLGPMTTWERISFARFQTFLGFSKGFLQGEA